MSIARTVIKYRNERRRRGALPAHPALMTHGLWGGFAFQRELESSLAHRGAV